MNMTRRRIMMASLAAPVPDRHALIHKSSNIWGQSKYSRRQSLASARRDSRLLKLENPRVGASIPALP